MKKYKMQYVYLVTTIVLWSITPALAKIALRELTNYQLLFYTSIVGTIALFIVNISQNKINLLKTYKLKDYSIMFSMGGLGIFLYYIFLYGGIAIAPAGQVNVINYLWPLFVIIFSIPLLKEKYNYKTIIAIMISFLGAWLAISKGNFLNLNTQYMTGYILTFFGAICYGLFSVLGKKLQYEKFSSMLVYYTSAMLLIIPTALYTSGFKVPQQLPTIIVIILLGGIINSLGFVFWFKALQLGNTHKTANMIFLVPFLAMIWTFFLNNEPFVVASIIGLILIIIGIFIQINNKIEKVS